MVIKLFVHFFRLVAFVKLVWGFQSPVHPQCQFDGDIFERIEDISALLHGGTVPTGVCIFNPTVTHLRGDLFLWGARAYQAHVPSWGCKADPKVFIPPITNDGWKGANTLILAVTKTLWNPNGKLTHTLVGFRQVDITLEDSRLFKDADGTVWILAHVPKGGFMTVAPVEASCVTEATGGVHCDLGLGGTRMLWFSEMKKVEKNWVPHSGSTRISYPHFPSFGPHSVLDWGSYHEPIVKHAFDSVASNESFFIDVNQKFAGLVQFAGSTPAVPFDDGVSYLAVGHVRSASVCFHDPGNPTGPVQSTCEAYASSQRNRGHNSFFSFVHEGQSYHHHYKEYAFFFYRFLASPPYEITHISLGLIPCGYYHDGVTFPAGLERIGPNGSNYLVSFGEANRYSRLLTISAANVRKVLVPIEKMRSAVSLYSLCTVPCAQ